jgi:hypothetical protein
MVAAFDGAACAPMSISRSWISAMRCASVECSASASRAARSLSAASTSSITKVGPPGASCATSPTRALCGTEIEPPSGAMSPRIRRSRVDLPVPLRPTRPTRWPAGIAAVARSKSSRPATR